MTQSISHLDGENGHGQSSHNAHQSGTVVGGGGVVGVQTGNGDNGGRADNLGRSAGAGMGTSVSTAITTTILVGKDNQLTVDVDIATGAQGELSDGLDPGLIEQTAVLRLVSNITEDHGRADLGRAHSLRDHRGAGSADDGSHGLASRSDGDRAGNVAGSVGGAGEDVQTARLAIDHRGDRLGLTAWLVVVLGAVARLVVLGAVARIMVMVMMMMMVRLVGVMSRVGRVGVRGGGRRGRSGSCRGRSGRSRGGSSRWEERVSIGGGRGGHKGGGSWFRRNCSLYEPEGESKDGELLS